MNTEQNYKSRQNYSNAADLAHSPNPLRAIRADRRLNAIEAGSSVFNVYCRVGFITLRRSYKAKTKDGFKLKKRTSAIQVRINISGIRSGIRSTGISLKDPDDFDHSTLTIKNDPVNSTRLQELKNDIITVYNERLMGKRSLNANLIIDIAMGLATHDDEEHYIMGKTKDGPVRDRKIKPRVPSAIAAIKDYCAMKEQMLGNGLVLRSVQRYRQHCDIIIDFIKLKYGVNTFLDDLTPAIEYDLFAYFKGQKKYAHNYTVKIIQFFKSILTYAHAHGWVDRNVMAAVRLSKQHKEVKTLSMNDLDILSKQEFDEPSLKRVRDIFLFCCYTGLAYTDVASLAPGHIVQVDGIDCIVKDRNKSGIRSFVPLFPEAIVILNRYAEHCRLTGVCLPVISNVKTNVHLKEIGSIAGIKESLHMHIARKTFTLFVEEQGFNIDHMAVMMGHTRATMTEQFYHQKRQGPVLKVFKNLFADSQSQLLAS